MILPTKFRVCWPFSSGEVKIDFQDGGHNGILGILGFQIRKISTIFDL